MGYKVHREVDTAESWSKSTDKHVGFFILLYFSFPGSVLTIQTII